MKSDLCSIKKDAIDLTAILAEVDKIAVYSELTHKEKLRLRLLTEELVGMLPSLLENCEGDLWLEAQGKKLKICTALTSYRMNADTREELIEFSKDKKNAASRGIMGKLRSMVDYMIYPNENMVYDSAFVFYGMESAVFTGDVWSLTRYKESVSGEKDAEAWDELEKSIVATLADDVVVGVRGKKVEITIQKTF